MDSRVSDRSSLRRYRTEIPNIVMDMNLSVYAFRLYMQLKRVAGDDGKCYYTARELAEQCQMSPGTISKAKQELHEADLIRIDRSGDWERDNITIVDLWPANFAHFSQEKVEVPQPSDHHTITPDHTVITPDHHTITKEEPIKQEPIKEVAASQLAPLAIVEVGIDAPGKMSTPQQEMFGAICEALGWDHRVITERNRAQVAQTVKILSKNGYSVDDIHRFMVEIWFHDWRWEKRQSHPTLSQLREDIGKIRNVARVAAPPKAKGVESWKKLAISMGMAT